MKINRLLLIGMILVSVGFSVSPAIADKYADTIEVFKKSSAVKPFFGNAYGYVVFPTVGKGGMVVGGAYGSGQVYAKGAVTGTAELVKLTVGFQLGGQAFSQMVFFEDKRAYDEFTSGSFEFDAGVSAVAITAGVQAKAGTEGATAGASAGPGHGSAGGSEILQGHGSFCPRQGGFDVRSHRRRAKVQLQTKTIVPRRATGCFVVPETPA
jgi:hypothetical protein